MCLLSGSSSFLYGYWNYSYGFFDRYSLGEFLKKRFRKAVVPFLAWSIIGLLEKTILHKIDVSDINLKYVYQGVTGTSIVSFYWFFSALFIIYLSMPLFSAVEKSKRETVFTYLVYAGFTLNILIPFLKKVFVSDLNTPYSVTVVTKALLWVPLGWLLYNKEIGIKGKVLVYSLAGFGLFLHIWGTYSLSMQAGEIISTYKGYQNVPCILYSVGMFVFLKEISNRVMHGKVKEVIKWLADYSFPIYLMQFVFFDLFQKLPFVRTRSLVYRLSAPFIIIPIIIGITWVMRKTPVLKRIVP